MRSPSPTTTQTTKPMNEERRQILPSLRRVAAAFARTTRIGAAICAVSTLAATSALTPLATGTASAASSQSGVACQLDGDAGQYCGKRVVEVMFVLDTTGSMSRLIAGAKQKIWAIANEVVENDPDAIVRIGLVGFRDLGDAYVTRFHDLTTDIDGLYAKLLSFRARGGGDTPESVNQALFEGITRANWTSADRQAGSKKNIRLLFLAGDAPPHMDYQQDVKYPEALKLARKRGITVNALQAGRRHDTRLVWREIASLGGGVYAQIPLSGNVQIIETPYDQQIRRLQLELDKTVIPYGNAVRRARTLKKLESRQAAAAPSSADRAAYYASKRGKREVVTGGADLVAELESGALSLDDVRPDALPAPLQSLTPAERKQRISAQRARRAELDGKLRALVKQRRTFLRDAKKTRKPSAGFDTVIQKSIRKAF